MGTFKSSRTFPYEVTGEPIPTGGWHVSVRKGGIFRTVSGLKTALNIKIEPGGNWTTVEAGIGVFGAQAIPTAITLFVLWPVILIQIWGLVRNSKLDEEALSTAEQSLMAHSKGDTDAVEGWLPPQEAR